jgi:uncharacterized protein (TIGR00251 family)
LILELHVQPGAKRSEFAGTHGARIKLRLAAPAVDGKANAALVEFLADYFAVPKRNDAGVIIYRIVKGGIYLSGGKPLPS